MLENEHIRLRAIEPTDLDVFYRWENDSAVWEQGITHNPYSRFALKQYLQNSHSDVYEDKELRLVIETLTGTAVGCIDLYDFDFHNQKAGVGILIDREQRRRGWAMQSISLLAEYAFDFLKINQLYAYIENKNNASRTLFCKCGFKQTATLQKWIKTTEGYSDVLLFQLFK